MSTQVIILILTILAALAAFIASKKDTEQKDRIENLGNINSDLSQKVKTLAEINNAISSNTDKIVKENKSLTEQNIELTKKANDLISKVQELINKLDVKTDHEFAVSGEFNLTISNLQYKEVTIIYGGNSVIQPFDYFKKPIEINRFFDYDGFSPLVFQINNNILFVTCKLYDLKKNLIVEIEQNKWRVNKNFVSKFNFDDKGIEIFDNNGRISISIDILPDNTIQIQGVMIHLEKKVEMYFTYGGTTGTSFEDKTDFIANFIKKFPFKQLFEYTGKQWHGVRKKY